ncbi:PREDICTED: N-acylneuraminate cytidylyltransferase [Papilio polytes]|uniref:N-acylneuraminate cytidylyltransferase n=1 Tax=Papilio polytes TaxID=76194 RepID=UPI000675F29E|nr:PREDICTED: N-acylneuraminate cytidylyltransferase [Papilio polytes]
MRVFSFVLILYTVSCDHDTVTLILARGGSKGIRLKNLQTVGGLSLIARSILTARKVGLSNITVSTDHPLIALEALKYGASPFRRSWITASHIAPSIWGVQEFVATTLKAKVVVLIQATSPFISYLNLKDAIRKLHYPKPYDCVFAATRSFKLRWNFMNGTLSPTNFNIVKRPRRQDWQGELIETGAFYISRVELIKQGILQNNNCTVLETNAKESLEIDSFYDLKVANVLLSSNLILT